MEESKVNKDRKWTVSEGFFPSCFSDSMEQFEKSCFGYPGTTNPYKAKYAKLCQFICTGMEI